MIFNNFLEHSLQTGLLILIVLFVTLLLRRTSKIYSYILWILVFVRLLVPVQFYSPMGVLPEISLENIFAGEKESIERSSVSRYDADSISGNTDEKKSLEVSQESSREEDVTADRRVTGEKRSSNMEIHKKENTEINTEKGIATSSVSIVKKWLLPEKLFLRIICGIWLLGVIVMGCYGALGDLRLKRLLKSAVCCEIFGFRHVYQCRQIEVPIVTGIVHPRIYLPLLSLEPYQQQYILEHEQMHIRRKDPLIKAISYVLLCINWFNPLVWLAFIQLERSMEYSCDEAVVKRLGSGQKKAYSRTLLTVAASGLQHEKKGVLAVGFLEKNTKKRIKNVLDFQYHGRWITVAVSMLLVGCFVCFLGGRGSFVPGNGWVPHNNSAKVDDKTGSGADTGQADGSKLRVQDDEDRHGLPVVVLDQDGNIIGTHGGKALEMVVLDYSNSIVNGESVASKGNYEYRIESGAFSACTNMEKLLFFNGSDVVTYVADDAFQGCPADLVVFCKKDTYLWKRLGELGITRRETRDEDIVYMLTDEKRGKQLQKKNEEEGINTFSREELREFSGDPYFLMVEGGRIIWGAGSLPEETVNFKEDIPFPSEARIISGLCGQNLGMQQAKIPKVIEEIDDGVFNCTDLRKLEFETENGASKLKRIGINAFTMCNFVDSPKLVIPEGVTEIGTYAFCECKGLQEIVLPKSLKKIGNGCFSSCTSLKKVTIKSPDVVFEEGEDGFRNTFSLCGVKYIEEKDDFSESEMIIYAPKDSTAQRYAKEMGHRFRSLQ